MNFLIHEISDKQQTIAANRARTNNKNMKNKLLIVSPVIIGMVAVLFFQHQAQVKLREQNESLQQQIESLQQLQQPLAQLKTDNANLSNRLAAANNAPSLPNDQFNELLKLRGEITQL
jgi:cytoskeletal protein RodZ